MDATFLIGRLAANAPVLEGLARGVGAEQARWKPSPEKWSILEVVCHLYDEEREDFRTRLDHTLHHPGRPWPPIDPKGWVAARGYADRDLGEVLDGFLAERRRSLEWLGGLQAPDWDAAYEHPAAGRVTAGDLLLSWVAHDHVHVRQLNRLHYEYAAAVAGAPYSPAYAGPW